MFYYGAEAIFGMWLLRHFGSRLSAHGNLVQKCSGDAGDLFIASVQMLALVMHGNVCTF